MIFLEGPRWQMANHGCQSPPSRLRIPAPLRDITGAPAPPRCDARRICPTATKEHKVKWPTQHYNCALLWDEYIRNAEVSLCHRCAFVPVNPLGCFWIDSDYILKPPKCLCYCLRDQYFVEHISAAFTNLKLNIYQVYSNFKCIDFNGQNIKATWIIYSLHKQ